VYGAAERRTAVDSAGATLDTEGYKLTVSDADKDTAGTTTVTPTSQPPPKLQPYLASSAVGATIELPGGKLPSALLTLTYDYHGKPSQIRSGQLPVIIALSAGALQPEVLPSHWDPDHQILTATTTHLSGFFPLPWTSAPWGNS
jgi:hypothetical protein